MAVKLNPIPSEPTRDVTGTVLEKIAEERKQDVALRKEREPLADLQARIAERSDYRPFSEALTGEGISIIAEFKRSSPTMGDIDVSASLPEVVRAYENGGAAAVSVLTEPRHFRGDVSDLETAKRSSDLPVLCKDFVVDPYQVDLAAAYGADAVLIIVGLIGEDRDLESCLERAWALDLDCLVEVHNEHELERAMTVDADVIGINNRYTFKEPSFDERIDLGITEALFKEVPTGKTVVSESGVDNPDDVRWLENMGVHGVLIGTHLMSASDKTAAIYHLKGEDAPTSEHRLSH